MITNIPGQELVNFTPSSNLLPQNTTKDSMSKVLCSKYSFFMPNLHIQMINETVVVVTWALCVGGRCSGTKTTHRLCWELMQRESSAGWWRSVPSVYLKSTAHAHAYAHTQTHAHLFDGKISFFAACTCIYLMSHFSFKPKYVTGCQN